jgi:hypothetical protein
VAEGVVVFHGLGPLARATGRSSSGRVRAPAPDLPPQSFGRNDTWQLWVVFSAFIALLIEAVMVLRWAFVLHGRVERADFLSPLALYVVVASFPWIFPSVWVAGGDGWLMLLRGWWGRKWVRTSRLVHVSVESRYEGEGDFASYLTLRDDEGRALGTWLKKLTAEAAASVLAGVRQSSQHKLADLSSPAAQAAVAALEVIALGK